MNQNRKRWIVGAVLLATSLTLYFASVSSSDDDFYASEFTRVTGMPLPSSARIVKAESSDWDLHGDHDTCLLIEVSPEDMQQLRSSMHASDQIATRESTRPYSDEMYQAFSKYQVEVESHAHQAGGEFSRWALASALPIVMVEYASW